jgi:hypothetical protein
VCHWIIMMPINWTECSHVFVIVDRSKATALLAMFFTFEWQHLHKPRGSVCVWRVSTFCKASSSISNTDGAPKIYACRIVRFSGTALHKLRAKANARAQARARARRAQAKAKGHQTTDTELLMLCFSL